MKPESAKAFQKANKSKVQLTEETVHADDTLPCCSSLRQYTAEEKKLCIVRGMKFGKFTLAEDEILKSNWAAYAQSNDLSHEDILDYVGLSRTNVNCLGQSLRSIRKETDFYKKLAHGLNRPLYDVYHRARKIFHPGYVKGSKFSAAEDQQLLQLVEIHQRKWNIIAESIERTPTHCVNRYFQLRQPGEMKNFSQEDEEKLCKTVENLTKVPRSQFNQLQSDDIDWSVVAKQFPGFYNVTLKRHWAFISKRANHPENPKFRKLKYGTAAKIVEEIMKQNVLCESEIDWTRVAEAFTNADSTVLSSCYNRAKTRHLKAKHLERQFPSLLRKLSRKLAKHCIRTKELETKTENELEETEELIDEDDIFNKQLIATYHDERTDNRD